MTPAALRAFIAARRRDLGVDAPGVSDWDDDHVIVDGRPVPPALRRLARRQCAALERGLHAAAADGVAVDPDETLDVLFRRRMLLLQARKGYRCNADSLILAAHVSAWIRRAARGSEPSPKPKDETTETTPLKVADLGAGSGVIGLALALSDPRGTARVLAAERQPALARRCERNAALNGVERRVSVCWGDVAKVFAPNESREKSDAGTGASPGVPANDAEDESSTRGGAGGDAGGGGRGGDSTNSSKRSSNETSSDDEAVHRVARAMFRGWLGACDAVVVNPPYHAREGSRAAGTPPATRERLEAHYETGAGLDEFAAAAARLLIVRRDSDFFVARDGSASSAAEGGGRAGDAPIPAAHFVYPADRAGRVVEACAKAGLDRVRTRLVFDAADAEEPTLALVTAWRGGGGGGTTTMGEGEGEGEGFAVVEESPPLVLYADAERKTYGEEIEAFMETLGLPPPDSRADFA